MKNYPLIPQYKLQRVRVNIILFTCTDGQRPEEQAVILRFWCFACPGCLSEHRVGKGLVAGEVSTFHESSLGESL